jgi:hypothetical protein
VKSFKAGFKTTAMGGGVKPVDPASVDAEELGDAESDKTLATE